MGRLDHVDVASGGRDRDRDHPVSACTTSTGSSAAPSATAWSRSSCSLLFWAVNLALVQAVTPVTGGGAFAVAGSTLVVAALFHPLRKRVQAIVDRRFHRSRYDAERLVAGLSGHLRDELDLAAVRSAIVATVDGSVEPRSVGLWLRDGGSVG